MPPPKDAPLLNKITWWLRVLHARGDGGIHAGAQAGGGGCAVCAVLREAQAVGLISGPWPSTISWDGNILNFGGTLAHEETPAAGGEGESGGA